MLQIDALHSPANSVTAPLSTDGDYYDTAPINEYFINSSHNTCEALACVDHPPRAHAEGHLLSLWVVHSLL